jgi:hypothetical protein
LAITKTLTIEGNGAVLAANSSVTNLRLLMVSASGVLTATVTVVGPGSGPLGGTVTFQANGSTLGVVAVSNGQAFWAVSNLGVGMHSLVAVYSGDSGHNGSQSAVGYQTVQPVPVIPRSYLPIAGRLEVGIAQ